MTSGSIPFFIMTHEWGDSHKQGIQMEFAMGHAQFQGQCHSLLPLPMKGNGNDHFYGYNLEFSMCVFLKISHLWTLVLTTFLVTYHLGCASRWSMTDMCRGTCGVWEYLHQSSGTPEDHYPRSGRKEVGLGEEIWLNW